MFMKMRKFFLFLLSIILLAGCGNNDPTTVQETTSIATESETTAETTLPDTLASADYEAYSFRIFGEEQTTLSDYYDVPEQTGELISDSVYDRNRKVEELYNIKLTAERVAWPDGTERIKTLILAGGEGYDLYTCTHLYLGALLVSITLWTGRRSKR